MEVLIQMKYYSSADIAMRNSELRRRGEGIYFNIECIAGSPEEAALVVELLRAVKTLITNELKDLTTSETSEYIKQNSSRYIYNKQTKFKITKSDLVRYLQENQELLEIDNVFQKAE
jgi:hypothetical protein